MLTCLEMEWNEPESTENNKLFGIRIGWILFEKREWLSTIFLTQIQMTTIQIAQNPKSAHWIEHLELVYSAISYTDKGYTEKHLGDTRKASARFQSWQVLKVSIVFVSNPEIVCNIRHENW